MPRMLLPTRSTGDSQTGSRFRIAVAQGRPGSSRTSRRWRTASSANTPPLSHRPDRSPACPLHGRRRALGRWRRRRYQARQLAPAGVFLLLLDPKAHFVVNVSPPGDRRGVFHCRHRAALSRNRRRARWFALVWLAGVKGAVPNIRYVARKKGPRLAPVGAVIVADLAHAIRVIHACALPPLGVILNAIGLVRHQQGGFHGAQHARDSLVVCRIAAE